MNIFLMTNKKNSGDIHAFWTGKEAIDFRNADNPLNWDLGMAVIADPKLVVAINYDGVAHLPSTNTLPISIVILADKDIPQ